MWIVLWRISCWSVVFATYGTYMSMFKCCYWPCFQLHSCFTDMKAVTAARLYLGMELTHNLKASEWISAILHATLQRQITNRDQNAKIGLQQISKTMVKVILSYDRYLSKEVSTRGRMHRTFPSPLKEHVCFLVGAGENLVLQTLGGMQPWFTNAGTCNVTPGYPHMSVLRSRMESFHAKELWWCSTLAWEG
jgi:hypothetical protein